MAERLEIGQKIDTELIRLLTSNQKSKSHESEINSDWRREEINCLLKLIGEYRYISQLKSNNELVFLKLSKLMTISGYRKTNTEIEHFWRVLITGWENYKKNPTDNSEYFTQICALLNEDPDIILEDVNFQGGKDEEQYVVFTPKRKEIRGMNWTHQETTCLVEVLLAKCDVPRRRNLRSISSVVVGYMKQHGFNRTEEQIQVKLKHLQAQHNQVLRGVSRQEDFSWFTHLQTLIHKQTSQENKNLESQNYITLDENSLSDTDEMTMSTIEISEDGESRRTPRQIWSSQEMEILLNFMEENRITTGKQLKRFSNEAVDYLAQNGFMRSPVQVHVRWKNTLALYWATFRKHFEFPEHHCPNFHRLHSILNPLNKLSNSKATGNSIDYFQDCSVEDSDDFSDYVKHKSATFKKGNSISVLDAVDVNESNNSSGKCVYASVFNSDSIEHEDAEKQVGSEQNTSLVGNNNIFSLLDSVQHYCLSLAQNIKKLDPQKQAKLKIEMQQLMYKAEFDPNF